MMTPNKFEEWLDANQDILAHARKGKIRFVKGRLIQRPEDLQIIRDAIIREKGGEFVMPDELKEVVNEVSKGAHLGDAITSIVLDYPTALRRRVQGQTSFFRLYGGTGVGKTQSTLIVMKHLLQLHSTALEALKGNIDKEKAHKMIKNTAEYVFSPYAGRHKIDWDKWTKDFMDGVSKYAEWSNAAKVPEGDAEKVVNIHNALAKVFAFNRAFIEDKGGTLAVKSAIKQAVGPVGVLDDFLANTNLDEIANAKDFYDAIGDSDFPTAMLVETENIQSETVEGMDRVLNSTQGVKDRSGIGLTISEDASEDVHKSSLQNMSQMSDDLYNSVLLDKLHTALYGEDEVIKKRATRDIESALSLGGKKDVSRRLQDIKSVLEKITGGDKEKASKLLKETSSAVMDIILEGENVYTNILKKTGANTVSSAVLHTYARVAADDELKANPDKLTTYLDTLQESIESLSTASGRDFSHPIDTTKNIKIDKSVDDYLLSRSDWEVNVDEDEAKKAKEELSKPTKNTDVTENVLKELEGDGSKKVQKIAEDIKSELKKKDVMLVPQLIEESNFDILMQSAGKGIDRDIFNFARVWENGKVCQVVGKDIDVKKLSADEKYLDLGEFGGQHVFLNKKSLEGSRTYKMWNDLHKVATEYLGEKDGKAMMRELILTAHGPSLAAHALMTSLGVYEKSAGKAKEKLPFLETVGQIYDRGLTIKEKYSKEDYEKISDILKDLSTRSDIMKLGSASGAIQHELETYLDSVINPDGTVNETANKALAGFEVLADMAGKDLEGLLEHTDDLDLDEKSQSNLETLLHNIASLSNSDKVELKEPDKKVKEALENRRKQLCGDKSGKKIVEAAKTVPNIVNHPVINLTSKLANKRAARLLSLAA